AMGKGSGLAVATGRPPGRSTPRGRLDKARESRHSTPPREETADMADTANARQKRRRARSVRANPLLCAWTTPWHMPPFDRIKIAHFVPAFDEGFAINRREMRAIARQPQPATFANTIEALERSGDLLDRVSAVFFNLAATDTNAQIQAIERALAPRFAKHRMRIYQDETLFARVDGLFKKRKRLKLTEEQARVLERYHRAFVTAGAGLAQMAKTRM